MKKVGLIGTGVLVLPLGVVVPAYGRQEHQGQDDKAATRVRLK
jgi:hypothetical protein